MAGGQARLLPSAAAILAVFQDIAFKNGSLAAQLPPGGCWPPPAPLHDACYCNTAPAAAGNRPQVQRPEAGRQHSAGGASLLSQAGKGAGVSCEAAQHVGHVVHVCRHKIRCKRLHQGRQQICDLRMAATPCRKCSSGGMHATVDSQWTSVDQGDLRTWIKPCCSERNQHSVLGCLWGWNATCWLAASSMTLRVLSCHIGSWGGQARCGGGGGGAAAAPAMQICSPLGADARRREPGYCMRLS